MNSTWYWILGSVLLLALLIWWFRRTNRAGISTQMSTRALRVGNLATKTFSRRIWLAVRSTLASKAQKEALKKRYHMQSAEEVAQTMGQMKGVFMKLGQIASFAVEGLPPEARKALEGLQKDAPPMAFPLVEEALQRELGGISKHFSDFDTAPLASASIGQVHRARLKNGRDVVVKVQYPGVDEAIRSDLRFTQGLVAMGSALFRNTDTRGMVEELKARMLDELDYELEAQNQTHFANIWRGHPLIRIPEVHREHCTKRVLVSDFMQGLPFNDFLALAQPREKRLAVHVLNDFVFDSMHLFDAFNGDPHPGNYLFAPDGGIIFLDFGCVKRFDGPFLADLRLLNRAIVQGDRETFKEALHRIEVILPGRPYEAELSWDFFGYHARPFAQDDVFTFTEDFLKEAGAKMNLDTVKHFNLPRDLVFFNRITFGLNAIFTRLGASENFHRHYRRYLFPHENVPPSLHALGVELPPHFLQARPWLPSPFKQHGS